MPALPVNRSSRYCFSGICSLDILQLCHCNYLLADAPLFSQMKKILDVEQRRCTSILVHALSYHTTVIRVTCGVLRQLRENDMLLLYAALGCVNNKHIILYATVCGQILLFVR